METLILNKNSLCQLSHPTYNYPNNSNGNLHTLTFQSLKKLDEERLEYSFKAADCILFEGMFFENVDGVMEIFSNLDKLNYFTNNHLVTITDLIGVVGDDGNNTFTIVSHYIHAEADLRKLKEKFYDYLIVIVYVDDGNVSVRVEDVGGRISDNKLMHPSTFYNDCNDVSEMLEVSVCCKKEDVDEAIKLAQQEYVKQMDILISQFNDLKAKMLRIINNND